MIGIAAMISTSGPHRGVGLPSLTKADTRRHSLTRAGSSRRNGLPSTVDE
jgi:hypothetical protein